MFKTIPFLFLNFLFSRFLFLWFVDFAMSQHLWPFVSAFRSFSTAERAEFLSEYVARASEFAYFSNVFSVFVLKICLFLFKRSENYSNNWLVDFAVFQNGSP